MREHVVGQDNPRMGPRGEVIGRPDLRVIGIEVRYRDPRGQVEELALFPMDVVIPCGANSGYMQGQAITVTVHTNHGDRNGEVRL